MNFNWDFVYGLLAVSALVGVIVLIPLSIVRSVRGFARGFQEGLYPNGVPAEITQRRHERAILFGMASPWITFLVWLLLFVTFPISWPAALWMLMRGWKQSKLIQQDAKDELKKLYGA